MDYRYGKNYQQLCDMQYYHQYYIVCVNIFGQTSQMRLNSNMLVQSLNLLQWLIPLPIPSATLGKMILHNM